MKNLLSYTLIIAGIIFLSMFFPYETHINKSLNTANINWGSNLGDIDPSEGGATSGFENEGALLLFLGLLVISLVTAIKKNVATAIIGSILGLGYLLYMPLLGFVLTFHLFSEMTYEVGFGFYIAFLAVFAYFNLLIIHLVKTIKNRNPSNVLNQDLIDDY